MLCAVRLLVSMRMRRAQFLESLHSPPRGRAPSARPPQPLHASTPRSTPRSTPVERDQSVMNVSSRLRLVSYNL